MHHIGWSRQVSREEGGTEGVEGERRNENWLNWCSGKVIVRFITAGTSGRCVVERRKGVGG